MNDVIANLVIQDEGHLEGKHDYLKSWSLYLVVRGTSWPIGGPVIADDIDDAASKFAEALGKKA